jgi:hypothetical protein
LLGCVTMYKAALVPTSTPICARNSKVNMISRWGIEFEWGLIQMTINMTLLEWITS